MKRAFDIVLSAFLLLVLLPLFATIVMLIFFDSGRPILFRQIRVGRYARSFQLLKFRSMRATAAPGLPITVAGDRRLTRVGKLLRRSKLDELPQLVNILVGDMSFVGPRPEVAMFVDSSTPIWRDLLTVRPGLVDTASLAWSNEEGILARYTDPIAAYREIVLPQKLAASRTYLDRRTITSDLQLIGRAILLLLKALLSIEKIR